MNMLKATFFTLNGKAYPVTIIGVNPDGDLIVIDNASGVITTRHRSMVVVDPAELNGQSEVMWLAERIDLLIQEIQAIQTHGLRLNK